MNKPTVTINIAIYNEEARIARALRSVAAQDYPRELVETIVVDGGSTDRSLEVCRDFSCTILHNPRRDGSSGRRIGCEAARGELHIYMDADMEWSHPSGLTNLVEPFLAVPGLVGSFPRYVVDPGDPAFNRCLSRHPLQQDPIFRFLSTQIEDTIDTPGDAYSLCSFKPGRAPVLGMVLYRTEFLRAMLTEWGPDWEWCDVDFAHVCAERGLMPFAYVPSAGVFHRGYMSPRLYLQKRRRDIRWSYLGTLGNRRASYVEWSSRKDLRRLLLWVIYVNLVIPGIVRATRRAIAFRDPAMLYEAFMETIGTDYVLAQFLMDRRGRNLIRHAASALFRHNTSSTPATSGLEESSKDRVGQAG